MNDVASSSLLKEQLDLLLSRLEEDLSFDSFFDVYEKFLNLINIILDGERKNCREFKMISVSQNGELLKDEKGFPILNDFIPEKSSY